MSIHPDSLGTMTRPSATPSHGTCGDQTAAPMSDDDHTLRKLRDAIGSVVQTRDTLLQTQKDDKGPPLHYESMIQTCNTMGVPLAKLAHEWGCTDNIPPEWLSATAKYPHHPETLARRTRMTLTGLEWFVDDLNNRTRDDKEYQATLQTTPNQTHIAGCSSLHTKDTDQTDQNQVSRDAARDLDEVRPVFMTDREMRALMAEHLAAEFQPWSSGTVHSGVYAGHPLGSESSLYPGSSFTPHVHIGTSHIVDRTYSAGDWDNDLTPRQAARLGQQGREQTRQRPASNGI